MVDPVFVQSVGQNPPTIQISPTLPLQSSPHPGRPRGRGVAPRPGHPVCRRPDVIVNRRIIASPSAFDPQLAEEDECGLAAAASEARYGAQIGPCGSRRVDRAIYFAAIGLQKNQRRAQDEGARVLGRAAAGERPGAAVPSGKLSRDQSVPFAELHTVLPIANNRLFQTTIAL